MMALCWLVFASLYVVGAWHKPYSAHDFYSWVYAQRCTVGEILTLEDTGIGHPPLFHLVQKGVQEALPFYLPINARLANFLFGSVYVIVFTAFLGRRPGCTLFCFGIAASATTLDTYMICRMWGLVCLISLLLIVTGERLRRRFSGRDAVIFPVLLILGFLSDYSFVLMLPYAVLVCLPRGRWGHGLAHLSLAGAALLLFLLRWRHAWKDDYLGQVVSLVLYDIFNASMVGVSMIFNFWFEETQILGLVVFIFCLARGARRAPWTSRPPASPVTQRAIFVSLALVLLCGTMVRTGLIRVRYAWIPLLLFLLLTLWSRRQYPFFDHHDSGDRFLAGLVGGSAILLAVSPYFWAGLVQVRFFLVLFPLLLLFLTGALHLRALRALALLMICSGLVYTASNGLFLYYPPPAVEGTEPVVFADVYSYSNHYFHRDARTGIEPYIIDQQNFVSSCRVCRMGSDHVPWERFHRFLLVGPANKDPRALVPEQFRMVGEEVHLSRLDLLQFGLLHPIYTQRYAVSVFQRLEPETEAP
jgi:hypothetical protein